MKHVTRKFHVVVVQNNGKEMYKKMCCTCKVAFLLIRPIVVVPFSFPLPQLALHEYIFCLANYDEILSRASLVALAKSIYYCYSLLSRIL